MRHHQIFQRKIHSNKLNNHEYETFSTGDDEQFSSNLSYRMGNINMDSIVDYLSDDESDSEMPIGCNLDVSNPVRDVVRQMLDNYLNDEKNNTEIEFPSSLFCHERIFVRQQAQQRNLLSRTFTRGASRIIAVSKTNNGSLLNKSNTLSIKQFQFSLKNCQLIQEIDTYLQTCPISSDDNDILQAKIQKTPSSLNDWFYCTLLRSGNPLARSLDIKPRIPDERFLFDNYFLPIDQTLTRDNLLHLIENNKMIFLNGPPAIGKSIRICQYINNDHFDRQWPIRILHSCSNSLSANALTSILSSSSNQSIDCFTFDNMSLTNKASSLITITTHEFLLHTLISGDYLLKSSITHLIIDDVHKRSHTLDMLLAYFKDVQQKFRHLKIIFIQTTIHYDALVKYFGNVVTYTIEMKNQECEEIFLDQILFEIENFDRNKCLSIENYGNQLLNYWCSLAEQSSRNHRISSTIICQSCEQIYSSLIENLDSIDRYLNDLLGRCFVNGLIEDFHSLINFLRTYPEKCNFQHILTLVTPLMCISMWSIKICLEQLFSFHSLLTNLRAVNNFSALDFARKYSTNEIIDYLEGLITHDSLNLEQLLCLNEDNASIMKYYLQTRKSNEVIDYQLILSIVKYVCQNRTGHILVFLPGSDEISILNDLCSNLSELGIEICMILNSTCWSSINQNHSRLLILCDAICEIGVPLRNINCIIDTGINFEKCYHTTTSKFLPKYNWINQTSANERKSRIDFKQQGICYRMYPRSLFDEKISENIQSEMARQPLLENIMQAKLFAWTDCSVAEFMLKLPFPPPFAVVRAGITQLKNLDLFDKWEDLVELGAYCLALPIVDVPYAMMIIYAHLFKCLQPILIIVSTLIIGDPFQSIKFFELKQRLTSTKNSDHFILYDLYEKWEQSNNKKEFCQQWHIKQFRMEQIDHFKKWLTNFLVNINFVNFFYSNMEEKIDLNENSTCWQLIEAIFVRCLPQNLLTYNQQWFTYRNELVVFNRYSILNSLKFHDTNVIHFAICDDLIRSNKGLFIGQYCTLIDDVAFLFFGNLDDYQLILSESNLLKLRTKINACVRRKLQSLGCNQLTNNDYYSFNLLVKIFSN